MYKQKVWLCFTLLSALINTICNAAAGSDHVIQVLDDTIEAENFTYYRLQRDGYLRLEVVSLTGDVDVYLSTETQKPSFHNYDLKSETCGIDVINLTPELIRPAYIGLYGHPNHLVSSYRMTIYSVKPPKVETYDDLVRKHERFYYADISPSEDSDSHKIKNSSPTSGDNTNDKEEDHELPLWMKILLGFVEFGIEVIF